MKKKKVVILGAGITGLAAAWKLSEKGYDVEVLEKEDHIGGLADNTVKWGLSFDTSPHGFSVHDKRCFKEFTELMGDSVFNNKKYVKLKYNGKYVQYPLTPVNMFFSLNFLYATRCGISLIWAKFKNLLRKPNDSSAEAWMINRYGKPLYDIVFKDYTTKIWGLKPSELSPNFARLKIPNISFLDLFIRLFSNPKVFLRGSHKDTPNIIGFCYPKKGGIVKISEKLMEKIKENGGKIHFNADITKVNIKNNQIMSVSYKQKNETVKDIRADYYFSTIPIVSLVELIEENAQNSEFLSTARSLKYRSLIVTHMLVNKNRVFSPQSIYYPTTSIFNRLTDHRSFDWNFEPENKTILVAEVTCQKDDMFWNMGEKEFIEKVIEDVEKEGTIKREEILDASITKIPYAYPIYNLGYEEKVAKILEKFRGIDNLIVGGRQGLFRYVDMHICFETGIVIADKIENEDFKFKKEKPNLSDVNDVVLS